MMEVTMTHEDREKIKDGILQKYIKVAACPEGYFRYPTGRPGLEGQRYDPEILKVLPEGVAASYCGVGNPFSLGPVSRGESALDIGCGAGVDSILAGMMVGPEGKVIGIDLVAEMLARAKENLSKTPLTNVSFQEASAEELPFTDRSFDVVISNGVFNLVPDKSKALREVLRVLKPGGRFMIADQVQTSDKPEDTRSMIESWSR
jgi:arsenite methyltransferase